MLWIPQGTVQNVVVLKDGELVTKGFTRSYFNETRYHGR